MPEQLQRILQRILDWWKKFNNKQRALLISIMAAIIVALGILSYVVTRPTMIEIYTAADMTEAASVNDILVDGGYTFETTKNGTVFWVDAKDEAAVNYLLAQNSYPSESYNFSNVTDGGFSRTQWDRQVLLEQELEKQFASDLEAQNGIESAIVNITLPKDDGTILSGDDQGTAAISLNLSKTLSEEQAYGIALFVATELGNDTTEGITIMDQNTNILYSGADANSSYGVLSSTLSNKEKQMAMVTEQVKNALSTIYTDVQVGLNLKVDFSSKETSEHDFSAPEGQDNGMIGSQSTYEASANNYDVDEIPGTDTNGDNTSYMLDNGGNSSYEVSDVDIQYQNNELITVIKDQGGNIQYDDSSITVTATRYLKYNEAQLRASGALDEITYEEYQELNSEPYMEEADESYVQAIATATGFSQDNVTLISFVQPIFINEESTGRSLSDILQIVLAVLIFALLGYVVFKSTRKQPEPEPEPELSVETLLEATAKQEEETLEDIGYAEKSETRLLIEKFVDENPEATALLLRNWLNDEWE